MVAALRHEGIGDVDRAAHGVGLDVAHQLRLQGFGVELVHVGEVHDGTLDGLHGEEVAGLGAQFAAYDVFIDAVVAGDAHAVERGLAVFGDAHLEVDGVTVDVDLHGVEVVEHVAVVVIKVADGVFVLAQALVEEFLIVDVALLHLQHVGEEVGLIDRVAHPADISQIIFPAFAEVEVDVYVLLVDRCHAVFEQQGVAQAPRIEAAHERGLVLLIFLGHELLGTEHVAETLLLSLLHRLLEFHERFLHAGVVGAVESRDINLVDLDLLVLIDIHVHDDAVVGRDVLFLHDFHGGVFIALALEVTLDDVLGAVGEVGGELAAGMEVDFLFEFLALALFHAVVVDGGDAGLGGEFDVQVDFAAHDAVGLDADVGE